MIRSLRRLTVLVLAGLAGAGAPAPAQTTSKGAWLDQPLANWNRAGSRPPPATPIDAEPARSPRCRDLSRPPSLPADRTLARAGWTLVGPAQVFGGTVVVAGMTNVDGMCRPLNYQEFVFVDGRFAGTLSPVLMDSRTDGAAATVRLVAAGTVYADFSRYAPDDPLCCPSRVSHVSYRIERGERHPIVVPARVATESTTR